MQVNGEQVAIAGEATLLSLVRNHFGLDPATVAIEMNGTIPERESWAQIVLSPDDRIEVIRFVGGG